jgi:CheY-like chemotaxis protein
MVRATHTHRVVVIEDDHELREAMMLLLTRHGCDVAGAADGVEALTCLATGPLPCVIFLDLMMPGMDGWRFMDELRVRPGLRAIPIVVTSAFGTPDGVRSLGAAEYLRKPFHLTRVVELVGKLCPFEVQP